MYTYVTPVVKEVVISSIHPIHINIRIQVCQVKQLTWCIVWLILVLYRPYEPLHPLPLHPLPLHPKV
jgi:hypothetical protein